jgi:hypothetical protein
MNSDKPPQLPSQDLDVLLLPFLLASSEEEEESLLTRLLEEHVKPIVRSVLRVRLYSNRRERVCLIEDFEEAYGEIQLNLLKRLRDCKSHQPNSSVANLRNYVLMAAHNACDDYFRKKFPRRRNLKDRIRYCLTTGPNLVLWEEAGQGWLSGLAAWGKAERSAPMNSSSRSCNDLVESLTRRLPGVDLNRLELSELITAILETQRMPIELDELTAVVARIRGIEDVPNASFDDERYSVLQRIPTSEANPAAIAEYHEVLEQLWDEIKRLPRRHRVALLCNLRDQQGVNVIMLFPVTGVATFEDLADVLEIPMPDFEKLWARLPLDDSSLAQYLGITRQQVINLRRSARDRLMRRLNASNTR